MTKEGLTRNDLSTMKGGGAFSFWGTRERSARVVREVEEEEKRRYLYT